MKIEIRQNKESTVFEVTQLDQTNFFFSFINKFKDKEIVLYKTVIELIYMDYSLDYYFNDNINKLYMNDMLIWFNNHNKNLDHCSFFQFKMLIDNCLVSIDDGPLNLEFVNKEETRMDMLIEFSNLVLSPFGIQLSQEELGSLVLLDDFELPYY